MLYFNTLLNLNRKYRLFSYGLYLIMIYEYNIVLFIYVYFNMYTIYYDLYYIILYYI